MPALRFKTCRLLSGNVWNRELTIIQRRILQRLRNKKRSMDNLLYTYSFVWFLVPGRKSNSILILVQWLFSYFFRFLYISFLYYFFGMEVAFCEPLDVNPFRDFMNERAENLREIEAEGMAFQANDRAENLREIEAEGMAFQAMESEGSDSSVSFNTFREQFNEGPVATLYERIQRLENQGFYNIPPQNEPGEYANVIQELLSKSIDIQHYLDIYNREDYEIQIFERMGEIENRLVDLMLTEDLLEKIMNISPYSNIRKEAANFLSEQFPSLSSLKYPEGHEQMDETLMSYVQDLTHRHKNAQIYQSFLRYFTDWEFRNRFGLPLPQL